MLIVKITGGLGNQLFQYAFARVLSKKLNRKLYIDDSWYHEVHLPDNQSGKYTTTIRNFLLNYYKIHSPIINKVHLNWIKRLEIRSKYSSFFKFLHDGPMNKFTFEKVNQSNYSFEVIRNTPRAHLMGYWQNNDIIDNYRQLISNDLILKYPLSEKNKLYLKSIESRNSIAIHFRRGDYLSDSRHQKIYATCSKNYYLNSIKQLQKTVSNIHLFIFSDDIEWVKKNYNFTADTTFIDNTGPEYEHLFLMSQCKHQITANSTFSWWAAWLNTYPKKLIITPTYWYHDKHLNEKVVRIPNEWIKINNMV